MGVSGQLYVLATVLLGKEFRLGGFHIQFTHFGEWKT